MERLDLRLSPAAGRDLDRLDEHTAALILSKLAILRDNPFPKGKLIKKLKGTKSSFYRLRIDKFRAYYVIDETDIVILRILSKKDAQRFIDQL